MMAEDKLIEQLREIQAARTESEIDLVCGKAVNRIESLKREIERLSAELVERRVERENADVDAAEAEADAREADERAEKAEDGIHECDPEHPCEPNDHLCKNYFAKRRVAAEAQSLESDGAEGHGKSDPMQALHLEREARMATEERAEHLRESLVGKNERVTELERRLVNLRSESKRDAAVLEALTSDGASEAAARSSCQGFDAFPRGTQHEAMNRQSLAIQAALQHAQEQVDKGEASQ